MTRKKILLALAPVCALVASNALAVPYSTFDPRSFAMGGTGVAAGNSASAGFMNPALLAQAKEGEDFTLAAPIVGVRAADSDDMVGSLDTFQINDNTGVFSRAITAFNTSKTVANANVAVAAGTALTADLRTLSNKALQGEVGVGFVAAIPSKRFGVAVTGNAWAVGGALLDITTADTDQVNQRLDTLRAALNSNDPTTQVAALSSLSDPTTGFTSSAKVRGAVIAEVGVSVARMFNVMNRDIAFGITPKLVKVETFDYSADVDTADVTFDTGRRSYTAMNVDLGAVQDFQNGWRGGMAVKNLLPKDYETALGNKIETAPQVRIGVSRSSSWTTLAVDLDVTENDAVGFDSKTQYLALGGEFDVFKTLQLRAGYRYNISDNDTSIPTLGAGLLVFGAHIDLAAAYNGTEAALSGQLGFQF